MTKKRLNGQFFTKNTSQILDGFSQFIKDKEVIDPFAGGQDLMHWAKENGAKKIKGFDVDSDYVDNKNVLENFK